MGLVKRIWSVFQGETHSLLDRLDNPEEQLSVFVRELNEHVQGLQRSVAGAIADEKRLRMQIEDLLTQAQEWDGRAVLALQKSDEPLAREALVRKQDCETRSLTLQRSWEKQREATQRLKTSLTAAKQKVADAQREYTLLLAQYRSAQTSKKIQETLSVQHADSPFALVDKLSDKIRQIEAETEAALEVAGEGASIDLEAKFLELERRQRGEDALAALKSRLAEGRLLPSYDDTAGEIEALKAKLAKP